MPGTAWVLEVGGSPLEEEADSRGTAGQRRPAARCGGRAGGPLVKRGLPLVVEGGQGDRRLACSMLGGEEITCRETQPAGTKLTSPKNVNWLTSHTVPNQCLGHTAR